MSEALHLIGWLGGRGVLFDAAQVESVVDVGEIVPAPRAGAGVRGLTALRSRVATVIDSWELLDLPAPRGDRRRAVTSVVDGQLYAVLLDGMEDVAPVRVAPLTPGAALGECWGAIASGAAVHAGEPMLVIDLPRMIARLTG
ncbi:MAG: chemotaxis protein CheW [Sphingomonas bacterium]